jgi:AcrR family transcriptional regulator
MARRASPRTRPALLQAAGELFYARGVASTALDEVAASAKLTKPTLYRHFPSKEALLAASLEERHEQLTVELRNWLESFRPAERPRAVIDWLCDSITDPGFNGCAFVRTYAELNTDEWVREAARRRKRVLLETIEDACRAAEASDPAALARELALIVEGATTMAFVSGDSVMAADAARRLGDAARAAAGLEQQ